MANAKYFIIETKQAYNPPDPEINDQLAFSKDFTIENRFFIALEFKQLKTKQEVKNIIFDPNPKDVSDYRIIPIIKEIKKYSKCDTLYVTNIPKTLNDPKQLMDKFCIGVGNIQKKLCYYTVISGRENLERLIHFLPAIPIEREIMASYSCIDFPILRFSNLPIRITEEKLKSFILQYAQCQVVDIKMSKPHQSKKDKYANVLFQSVEEIEKVTRTFNFSTLKGNEIYVKQFLEPELGNEIKKYEIAVVDLPEDTERISFFKEMSNFGRIFEFSFDEDSLIGYVVFVTSDARKKLLKSTEFHSFYSLVNILVGNFPPNTTCDDAKNYVIETIKKNSKPKKDEKKSLPLRITKNSNDVTFEIQKKENEEKDDFDIKLTDENYEFDPNSIKEVKIYQEEDQLLSPDSPNGKLYFTLPTFSFKFNHPSEIDFVLDKLKNGIYKGKTAPFAIRYYTQSKHNDNERSGILKNLGYDNAIVISPIDQKVTLINLFDICSKFGVILYFQVNFKKIPNYCIVKYQTSEISNKALEYIDGSVLNKQKISAMEFKQEKKGNVDQSDNSESQEKTDDSTKEDKSKCKKKCQCKDHKFFGNQHHQYPPFFQRPPFSPYMMCPPYGRPPPMCPPPFQYPYFQGQGPPPGPPPSQEDWMEWMNFYRYQNYKHHKQNHCQKGEQFNEENDKKDDQTEMKKNREINPDSEEKQNNESEGNQWRKRGPRCWGRRNYYCQNNESGKENQTVESDDNQERRRFWKNHICHQNFGQQNESFNNAEKGNNNNNDDNQTDKSAEMPRRRCYYRKYWEGNAEKSDQTEDSDQNQMNQKFFRGHCHHRNHCHHGRGMWWPPNQDEFSRCQDHGQQREENDNHFHGRESRGFRRGGRCGRFQNHEQQGEENDNQLRGRENRGFRRGGRCGRFQNYEQQGEENDNQFRGRENRGFRRGGRCGRCGRGGRGYQADDLKKTIDEEEEQNNVTEIKIEDIKKIDDKNKNLDKNIEEEEEDEDTNIYDDDDDDDDEEDESINSNDDDDY